MQARVATALQARDATTHVTTALQARDAAARVATALQARDTAACAAVAARVATTLRRMSRQRCCSSRRCSAALVRVAAALL